MLQYNGWLCPIRYVKCNILCHGRFAVSCYVSRGSAVTIIVLNQAIITFSFDMQIQHMHSYGVIVNTGRDIE